MSLVSGLPWPVPHHPLWYQMAPQAPTAITPQCLQTMSFYLNSPLRVNPDGGPTKLTQKRPFQVILFTMEASIPMSHGGKSNLGPGPAWMAWPTGHPMGTWPRPMTMPCPQVPNLGMGMSFSRGQETKWSPLSTSPSLCPLMGNSPGFPCLPKLGRMGTENITVSRAMETWDPSIIQTIQWWIIKWIQSTFQWMLDTILWRIYPQKSGQNWGRTSTLTNHPQWDSSNTPQWPLCPLQELNKWNPAIGLLCLPNLNQLRTANQAIVSLGMSGLSNYRPTLPGWILSSGKGLSSNQCKTWGQTYRVVKSLLN